jgi:hypothetical protein
MLYKQINGGGQVVDDPVKFSPNQLVTSTKLVRSLSHFIDVSKEYPLFIARGDEIEAVIMGIDQYRELLRARKEVEK